MILFQNNVSNLIFNYYLSLSIFNKDGHDHSHGHGHGHSHGAGGDDPERGLEFSLYQHIDINKVRKINIEKKKKKKYFLSNLL